MARWLVFASLLLTVGSVLFVSANLMGSGPGGQSCLTDADCPTSCQDFNTLGIYHCSLTGIPAGQPGVCELFSTQICSPPGGCRQPVANESGYCGCLNSNDCPSKCGTTASGSVSNTLITYQCIVFPPGYLPNTPGACSVTSYTSCSPNQCYRSITGASDYCGPAGGYAFSSKPVGKLPLSIPAKESGLPFASMSLALA